MGVSIFLFSFHDDVPKDYRQVSLMAVKQRFEDERYEEIGKEQVGELWLHLLLADTQSRAAVPSGCMNKVRV